MKPVAWGVLGAAKIAREKVIPALQKSDEIKVVAIASRDKARAQSAAAHLGIERAYGSYEELLADPDIEVIYNPLPNHLHVPWTTYAARAGKHVLCEKPIALSAEEARGLLTVRAETGVQIAEAFMVRTHPQWLKTRELVLNGEIGELQLVSGHFSYFLRDPANVRNRAEWGGGALMDIGCYPVMLARWLFTAEPLEVCALMERDPDMHVDRLTAGLLRFARGQAAFTCATQLAPAQRMHIFGSSGHIEVEIPFNAPPDRPCRIFVNQQVVEFPVVDQYTTQGEQFSRAVRGLGAVPVSLEDAIGNMTVLDALFRSAESRGWQRV